MDYYTRWKLNPKASQKLAALLASHVASEDVIVLSPIESTPRIITQPPSQSHANCLCGIPTRYIGGNSDSFMAYICPTCKYCYRNCVCAGAPIHRVPPHYDTVPPGAWWQVWNYGLFGDERAADVPEVCFVEPHRFLVGLPTYDHVDKFTKREQVLHLSLKPTSVDRGILVGSLQLPTTYSICGHDNATPHQRLLIDKPLWDTVREWYVIQGQRTSATPA